MNSAPFIPAADSKLQVVILKRQNRFTTLNLRVLDDLRMLLNSMLPTIACDVTRLRRRRSSLESGNLEGVLVILSAERETQRHDDRSITYARTSSRKFIIIKIYLFHGR